MLSLYDSMVPVALEWTATEIERALLSRSIGLCFFAILDCRSDSLRMIMVAWDEA